MIKCIVSVVSSCSYDKPKREIQFHWNRENIVNVEITNKRTEKKNNNNKNTKYDALTWKWVKYANILSTILLSMGNHRNNETTNRIDIRRERKFPQWSESNHWTQETFEIQRGHNSKKSNVLHFHAILMNGMIFTAYNRTLCTRCSNQILCKKHYFSYFLLLFLTAICVSLLLRCEIISYSSCNIDVTKWPSHLFPEMCLQIKNINFSHRRTIELDFLEREKKRTNQQKNMHVKSAI